MIGKPIVLNNPGVVVVCTKNRRKKITKTHLVTCIFARKSRVVFGIGNWIGSVSENLNDSQK